MLPRNGSVLIPAEKRRGDIVVEVLSDNVPELTETYRLKLTKIVGGAEIDSQYNVSTFKIRYHTVDHIKRWVILVKGINIYEYYYPMIKLIVVMCPNTIILNLCIKSLHLA